MNYSSRCLNEFHSIFSCSLPVYSTGRRHSQTEGTKRLRTSVSGLRFLENSSPTKIRCRSLNANPLRASHSISSVIIVTSLKKNQRLGCRCNDLIARLHTNTETANLIISMTATCQSSTVSIACHSGALCSGTRTSHRPARLRVSLLSRTQCCAVQLDGHVVVSSSSG